ncbi:hypothetical protein TEA_023434 [Camellia sinensis var. sinensis]|uniref:Uncharacterized protein n=1 Tax=Camellia sinensis var. sinensis TaxID=542762 RepID=A0A4S4CXZ2_CAMSN|nr:hypothetical protein TEA_023434 [Camellia sinensis var. sinensis]
MCKNGFLGYNQWEYGRFGIVSELQHGPFGQVNSLSLSTIFILRQRLDFNLETVLSLRRSEQDKEPEQVVVSEVVGSSPSEECVTDTCDVPGIKRLVPRTWREWEFFDNIYELVGVPVVTVQLRYNGWVTELQDLERSRQVRQAAGLDNLLYTPDADFSCFADLALSSPEDYYLEGQGSLLQ